MEIFNGVSPLLRIMGHRFKMSICFKRPCITVTKHAIIIILTTHMVVPAVREFSFHMRFICHSKSRMKNGSLPPWNFSVNLQIWWNNSRESTVSYWAAFILIPTLQNRFEVREYQRVRSVVGRDFNAAGEHYCSVVGQVLCFALGLLALCIMCVFAPGLHCAMSLKSQVKRWMEFFINRRKQSGNSGISDILALILSYLGLNIRSSCPDLICPEFSSGNPAEHTLHWWCLRVQKPTPYREGKSNRIHDCLTTRQRGKFFGTLFEPQVVVARFSLVMA